MVSLLKYHIQRRYRLRSTFVCALAIRFKFRSTRFGCIYRTRQCWRTDAEIIAIMNVLLARLNYIIMLAVVVALCTRAHSTQSPNVLRPTIDCLPGTINNGARWSMGLRSLFYYRPFKSWFARKQCKFFLPTPIQISLVIISAVESAANETQAFGLSFVSSLPVRCWHDWQVKSCVVSFDVNRILRSKFEFKLKVTALLRAECIHGLLRIETMEKNKNWEN